MLLAIFFVLAKIVVVAEFTPLPLPSLLLTCGTINPTKAINE
jgi:hypothetical protein